MIPPRILVIDDQLATEAELQGNFCAGRGLVPIKVTTSDCELEELCKTSKAIAGALFTSGQVKRGEFVENSFEEVRNAVRSGWANDHAGWRWALVLLDLHFASSPARLDDDTFGLKVLDELVQQWPDSEASPGNSEVPIVMLSSIPRKILAKEANRGGALAYVEKDPEDPLKEPPLTRVRLEELLDEYGLVSDEILVGRSLAFLKILRQARRVARIGAGNAMILGPSGSGKTDLASYIHRRSNRREGPFERYLSKASAENLEQASLFGYWEGAYTGATINAKGSAERAHQGTLFIDEVHNLTEKSQVELLEFALPRDEGLRLVTRLGQFPAGSPIKAKQARDTVNGELVGNSRIFVDVFLLSATDQPVDDPTWRKDHKFSQALYGRLATKFMGQPLRCPSLDQRKEDIPILFDYFLKRATEKNQGRTNENGTKSVDAEVYHQLSQQTWHTNLSALSGVAEDVAQNARDFPDVFIHHLPRTENKKTDLWVNHLVSLPVPQPANHLRDAEEVLGKVEVPRSLRDLEGRLPSLQKAYGKLVRNILEAAFEEGKGPGSITPTMKRLFPAEVKDTTQAYDKLLNLSGLFMRDNPPALDSQLGLAIEKAENNRRPKKAKKAPPNHDG